MESSVKFQKELTLSVKQKPELSGLDDEFVLHYLNKHYLALGSFDMEKYSSFKQCLRSKKTKELISLTRKDLRTVYGLFLVTPLSEKSIFSLDSYDNPKVDVLLNAHRSTQERLSYYSSIYPLLFDTLFEMGLSKEFSLLDVACGYNPLAYRFFPAKPSRYVACDLSSKEMGFINDFFKKTGIVGEAFGADVTSEEFALWLSKHSFDVCFLFKALDSFEFVKRHLSKKVMSSINAKFFVVSFPLLSIGGVVEIAASKRTWFERFCQQNEWHFKTLQVPNEIFYVIRA